jgi:uncharacterized protein (DUF2336 family)
MPDPTVFDDILDLALARDVARRPTLVRVLVDGFCRDEHPRSAAEIRQFEELMLHMLGQVDAFTRAVAAQRLSRRHDVPMSLIERFASEDEVAEPILAHSPLVTPELIDRVIAQGGSSARAGLARRSDLTPAQRAALAAPPVAMPPAGEAGEKPSFEPPPIIDEPRAPPLDFFAAPPELRRATLHRLSATALERTVEPVSVEKRKALVRFAVLRQRDAFAAALADGLGISPGLGRRIADDPDGEPLVVAAAALGFDVDALAQLLLLVNPAVGESYEKVTKLRDLFRLVTAEAASVIVTGWRNTPLEPRRSSDRAVPRAAEAEAVVPFRDRSKDRANGTA